MTGETVIQKVSLFIFDSETGGEPKPRPTAYQVHGFAALRTKNGKRPHSIFSGTAMQGASFDFQQ